MMCLYLTVVLFLLSTESEISESSNRIASLTSILSAATTAICRFASVFAFSSHLKKTDVNPNEVLRDASLWKSFDELLSQEHFGSLLSVTVKISSKLNLLLKATSWISNVW